MTQTEEYIPIEEVFATQNGRTYTDERTESVVLEFGNMVLSLHNPCGLAMLNEFLLATDLTDVNLYQPHMRKKLVLQMAGSDACYCFTVSEFLELKQVMQGTLEMLELNEIIKKL